MLRKNGLSNGDKKNKEKYNRNVVLYLNKCQILTCEKRANAKCQSRRTFNKITPVIFMKQSVHVYREASHNWSDKATFLSN